jgi:hypothetical protein
VGDLGWAVEAEGQAYGADASVDVELHVVEVEEALHVLDAHGWKDERADEGQAELAAVGVAGEHEIGQREAWVPDEAVDVVWLVTEYDAGGVGLGWDGEAGVWGVDAGVVEAAEPEVVAAALDGDVAVDEDRRTVGFERIDDVGFADHGVVVAEDAEALGGFEAGEDFGADAGRFPGVLVGEGASADEVAGDEDEFGVEQVDLANDLFEEPGLGELFEVEIADLDDAEALEGVGQVADGEGAVGDVVLVAGVGAGVGCDSKASDGGTAEEAAARHGHWIGRRSRHGGWRHGLGVQGLGLARGAKARGHSPSYRSAGKLMKCLKLQDVDGR